MQKILVNNRDLIENADKSTLKADVAASAGTITVESINQFAINKILLIGELGKETAEIIKTHASTAPTGNTVTLASNTGNAHSHGEPVYIIDYDQYEISWDSTATATTPSATLVTEAIDIENEEHLYNETTKSSGYYYVRKKETIGNTFSAYSDAIPYAGWGTGTVGYAIQYALVRNGGEYTDDVTHQFCIEEINNCLKTIEGKQLRWPQHQVYNYVLGQTSRGTFIWTLPTDIYDNDTNKSIVAVRIGDGARLTYKDPIEFEEELDDAIYTQVTTQATAGSTTLAIDNSYDFADSGSVNVYVSGTKYNLTYTGVTRSATAGVLTGIPASGTGAITVTIAVDIYVFQNEDEGEPKYFTIRNGNLEIWPLSDSTADNENVYLDYFTVATEVDTDGDTLDTERADMVKYYLTAKVRAMIKNGGIIDPNDTDYMLFGSALADAIKFKRSGLKHKMKPKLNTISY